MTQVYYDRALAPSTKSTYSAGQERFMSFCKSAKVQSMSASESTLLLFATHLATSSISYATIKIYLSAIRHMHVTAGMHSFFNQQLTPRLQQVLKGIQKSQPLTHSPRIRLPITIQIMENILQLLSQRPKFYMTVMTWAACCLSFFEFLRVCEFTVPSDDQFDQTCHLCLSDIVIDNRDNPRMLQVKIKQSKTDPFRNGVNIYLGETRRDLCPTRGILPYLALRGNCSGPLFILQDGRGLTRHLFKEALDGLLSALNMDKRKCNTHSFHIGAATSAK